MNISACVREFVAHIDQTQGLYAAEMAAFERFITAASWSAKPWDDLIDGFQVETRCRASEEVGLGRMWDLLEELREEGYSWM